MAVCLYGKISLYGWLESLLIMVAMRRVTTAFDDCIGRLCIYPVKDGAVLQNLLVVRHGGWP